MDYIIDWLNLILRWFHLITGIAWIGSSFYFMWLDYSLEPPKDPDDSVKGENWSVHGGGFYHVKKFQKSPPQLPENLHWFKWEAYTTWVTGFLLLILLYYVRADLYLIDKFKADLNIWQASLLGILAITLSWLAYNLLCRSVIGRNGYATALIGFLGLLGITAWLNTVFSDRGAFMHAGAIMGTVMAANVFMVIIPNQKKIISSLIKGEEPDPALAASGKLRSTHNNYITLPVLIVMISNHFPLLYAQTHSWAVLGALIIIGGVLRHFFNLKNQGKTILWLPILPVIGVILLAWAIKPQTISETEETVIFKDVAPLFQKHCVSCHAEKPTFEGLLEAPKGVILTDERQIRLWAGSIKQQVVDSNVMPLGNLTNMSKEERLMIGSWIQSGAE